MTRKHLAVILNTVLSFNKRCKEIANLRYDREYKSEKRQYNVSRIKTGHLLDDKSVEHTSDNGKKNTAKRSLNRLFGTQMRCELVLTEHSAGEVRKNVAHPRSYKYKSEDIFTVGHISRK